MDLQAVRYLFHSNIILLVEAKETFAFNEVHAF